MILQSQGKYFTDFHNSAYFPTEPGVIFKGVSIIVKENSRRRHLHLRVERVG